MKKNYRLLPGRKQFRLQMICKRPSNYGRTDKGADKSDVITKPKFFAFMGFPNFLSYGAPREELRFKVVYFDLKGLLPPKKAATPFVNMKDVSEHN